MTSVLTHVVVASKKAMDLGAPSGNQTQASKAHAAIISSVAMPAPATLRR